MEVYTLDSLLRRTDVIDKFESFIWTERWQEVGDFELKLASTYANRSRFTLETQLAMNNSHRVMTVESVEDVTDADGKEILTVSGRSLESILEERPMYHHLMGPGYSFVTNPATPGNILRAFFDYVCRDGWLGVENTIPFLAAAPSFYPEDTIPEFSTNVKYEIQPTNLLEPFLDISKSYDLGFRLIRDFDNTGLYFDVYTGQDRTTRQSILPPVVISPNLDNLQNTKEFTTIQGSKNVAYVFSEAGLEIVFGEGVDPEVGGFERRVLVVNASDIELADPEASTKMIQVGTEELLRNRASSIFDGELNQNGMIKYGTDYELGDLVEMRNKDGIISYKRVTEQIFTQDAEGEKSYPTLSIDLYTGVDTWLNRNNDPTTWADMTTEVWEDM